MLIIGAGGLATQLFDELVSGNLEDIVFWSEVETMYGFIGEKFPIIKTDDAVSEYFSKTSRSFTLCIGNPEARRKLAEKFRQLGGELTSYISPNASFSKYVQSVGAGVTVLGQTIVEPGIILGEGCLLNKTASIGHGCTIGAYSEISPGVLMAGEVEVGENVLIGMGAIIFPKIKIGKNSSVAAGSVIRKDVPENSLVSGQNGEQRVFAKSK